MTGLQSVCDLQKAEVGRRGHGLAESVRPRRSCRQRDPMPKKSQAQPCSLRLDVHRQLIV